jgi:hypothetical protein
MQIKFTSSNFSLATSTYVIKYPIPKRLLFNFGTHCKNILDVIVLFDAIVATISNIKALGNSTII